MSWRHPTVKSLFPRYEERDDSVFVTCQSLRRDAISFGLQSMEYALVAYLRPSPAGATDRRMIQTAGHEAGMSIDRASRKKKGFTSAIALAEGDEEESGEVAPPRYEVALSDFVDFLMECSVAMNQQLAAVRHQSLDQLLSPPGELAHSVEHVFQFIRNLKSTPVDGRDHRDASKIAGEYTWKKILSLIASVCGPIYSRDPMILDPNGQHRYGLNPSISEVKSCMPHRLVFDARQLSERDLRGGAVGLRSGDIPITVAV